MRGKGKVYGQNLFKQPKSQSKLFIHIVVKMQLGAIKNSRILDNYRACSRKFTQFIIEMELADFSREGNNHFS